MGQPPHQIAAVSGHLTLKEVERYTKAYDRKARGHEAMAALVAAQGKAARVSNRVCRFDDSSIFSK